MAQGDKRVTLDGLKAVHDYDAERVDGLVSAVNELQTGLLNSYPTDSASGSIANFPDGAGDVPIKALNVEIEPVQDLHGQESPYPAGGGKNLLPPQSISGSMSNVNVSSDDGVITLNGTASAYGQAVSAGTFMLDAGTYYLKVFTVSGSGTCQYQLRSTDGVTTYANTTVGVAFTLEAQTTIKARVAYASGAEFSNLKIEAMVVSGSVEPTAYAPYSNICPISGWTGANVTRTGKNVYNISEINKVPYQGVTIERVEDKLHVYGTATASAGFAFGNFHLMPGSYIYSSTTENLQMVILNGYAQISGTIPTAFTVSSISNIYRFKIQIVSGTTYDFYISNVQIELGSTATSYEPYQGETYDITFPSDPGTVYGGTLDVVSGVLTVDRAMVDLGTLTWTANGSGDTKFFQTTAFDVKSSTTNAICSQYKYSAISTANTAQGFNINGTRCRLRDAAFVDSTATEFKTAMSGVQIVYELATPLTYNLTQTEIKTLVGTNNIWCDAGDVGVTYRADIALYIQKMTGSAENDMIADSPIASGKYFLVGNTLYLSTAAIAAGAKLTPGTNCVQTTLADALNALNN